MISDSTGSEGGFRMNKNKRKSVKPAVGIDPPERRFGSIAMDKGFIKADQLYEALMRQRAQETRGGERRPLGMILKDLGYLSVAQVDEILEALEHGAGSTKNTPA